MSNALDDTARYALISRVVLASVGLPMFISGLVGNLMNVLIFASLPQFNKLSSSVFLISSFTASIITLLSGLLPQLIYRISGYDPLSNYAILCKLRWYLGPLAGSTALHCLCFAMINQYLITSRTLQYHQLITRKRAMFVSCLIVLFWIGPISPSLIFYTTIINTANVTIYSVTNPIFTTYNAYLSILVYSLIPIFVLSIFSLLTWNNVRNNLIRHRVLEQTFTRILLAQIVMVLLTTIPNVVNQMYFFYTRTIPKSSLRIAEESLVSSVFTLFVYSTHSFSFHTYLLASKTFRKKIRSTFLLRPAMIIGIGIPQRLLHINGQLRT